MCMGKASHVTALFEHSLLYTQPSSTYSMAPGRKTAAGAGSAAAIADIPDTNLQLEIIISKLTALETLPAKVAALEKLLQDSNAKNVALQKQVAANFYKTPTPKMSPSRSR